MGTDYDGQDKAIKELNKLSREAKMFLNHHIANSLCGVLSGIEHGNLNMAKEAAWHIVKDLRLAGIKEK